MPGNFPFAPADYILNHRVETTDTKEPAQAKEAANAGHNVLSPIWYTARNPVRDMEWETTQ